MGTVRNADCSLLGFILTFFRNHYYKNSVLQPGHTVDHKGTSAFLAYVYFIWGSRDYAGEDLDGKSF